MKSPHYKLQKAMNNLRLCLQIATRSDLTVEEVKLLKGIVRSYELAVALNEKRLAESMKHDSHTNTPL